MAERYTPRRMSDRRDGRRLHTLSPVFQLTPFMMRSPADAEYFFTDRAELTRAESWVRVRRDEGDGELSLMHVFIAAYVRTLCQWPALNRFVAGRFLYARDHIDVVLASSRSGTADSGSMNVKVRFLPTDTIYDISRKIRAQLESLQADESAARRERLASTLIKTPRFVLTAAMGVVRWLDYHGWLGEAWTDRSPFHGSAVLSDEGSHGLPPVSRTLNSLGSMPVSISIGRRHTEVELTRTGAAEERYYADYTVTVDSRIADSAYVGAAFRYFRQCLADPSRLEQKPPRVNDDAM
ncbi:MAG: hypothetical protein IKD79_04150 [Oscillospiraceae bacterium]|nr:hypothetical protein [Oscillospiraceae bacterium]